MKNTFYVMIILFLCNRSEADIIYVSKINSGACTINSIQEAIDLAVSGDEIRIVSNEDRYYENLLINKDLIIKGGYTSCGLAQLDSREDFNYNALMADSLT